MLRLLVLWLLALGAVAGCSNSPADGGPTPLPAQPGCSADRSSQPLCIVVLGDSLAVGVPVAGADRWWERLGTLLRAARPDLDVVIDNWALSGARVDVLEAVAAGQPELGSYDLAIVIEGVNDEPFLSNEDWLARYEGAIAGIERRGVNVILATPPPSFEEGRFQTRYDRVADGVRQVAQRGRALIDIAAQWRAVGPSVAADYYADLIHQSTVGQRQIAELALGVVVHEIDGHPAP